MQLSEFLPFILNQCLNILESRSGSILLMDRAESGFVVRAAQGGRTTELLGTKLRSDQGVAGHVATEGKPLLVYDVRQEHELSSLFRTGQYVTHSFVSVPIKHGEQLFGVINVTEKKCGGPFSEKDLTYLASIAETVAKMIEAVLYSEHLERQVQSFKDSTAVTKFTSAIAHDLNNPLDGSMRFTQLALRQAPEGSRLKEYIGNAYEGLRRISEMIKSMLDFSFAGDRNYNPVRRELIDLNELWRKEIDFVQEQARMLAIDIQGDFSPDLPPVRDCGLSQVVMNLLQNAMEAVRSNGTIEIRTYRTGQQVFFSVADTGSGIEEAVQHKLFEPFFSTKAHGKGLGLAIVREVLGCCNGAISAINRPEGGACFTVTLPLGE